MTTLAIALNNATPTDRPPTTPPKFWKSSNI